MPAAPATGVAPAQERDGRWAGGGHTRLQGAPAEIVGTHGCIVLPVAACQQAGTQTQSSTSAAAPLHPNGTFSRSVSSLGGWVSAGELTAAPSAPPSPAASELLASGCAAASCGTAVVAEAEACRAASAAAFVAASAFAAASAAALSAASLAAASAASRSASCSVMSSMSTMVQGSGRRGATRHNSDVICLPTAGGRAGGAGRWCGSAQIAVSPPMCTNVLQVGHGGPHSRPALRIVSCE